MTGLRHALSVIIVVGKVLIEIRLGNPPVLLWNPRKHKTASNQWHRRDGCASNKTGDRTETFRVLRFIPSWVRQLCLFISLVLRPHLASVGCESNRRDDPTNGEN